MPADCLRRANLSRLHFKKAGLQIIFILYKFLRNELAQRLEDIEKRLNSNVEKTAWGRSVMPALCADGIKMPALRYFPASDPAAGRV